MHPVLAKTLGGQSKEYYFRSLFFGALPIRTVGLKSVA